jgi:hypothetical protein
MKKIILLLTILLIPVIWFFLSVKKEETKLISPVVEPIISSPSLSDKTYLESGDYRIGAISELLREEASPLREKDEAFISCADNNHINPYVLVGISRVESTLGKNACAGNPFGWSSCKDNFATFEASCQAAAKGISDLPYYARYRNSGNIEDLGSVYCPLTDGCNTDHWIKTVEATVGDLQERELVLSLNELASLTPSGKSIKDLEINIAVLQTHSKTSTALTNQVIQVLLKANKKTLNEKRNEQ